MLILGFQLPHMDFPHVTRPIGMMKLKLQRDTSGNSDTHSAHSHHSHHSQSQAQAHGKTSAQIQRDVDMYHSRVECLSPEDIATIRSGSVSLMDDDCDLRSDVSASAGYRVPARTSAVTGPAGTGAAEPGATVNLAGIATVDTAESETEETPTNVTTSSTDSNVASTAATTGDSIALRQQEHQRQV